MTLRAWVLGIGLGGVLCLLGACSTDETECLPGGEGCPCGIEGACNGSLVCEADRCVDQASQKKKGGEDCSSDAECASGDCVIRKDDFGNVVSQTCKAETRKDAGVSADKGGKPAPLTADEIKVSGKWTYFYSYSGERHYLIFNKDRTGCEWYELPGSSTRKGVRDYVKWELKKTTTLYLFGYNVNGGFYKYKYEVASDKLWGTKDKVAVRSTTSKTCD